jgi:hypothetical protein
LTPSESKATGCEASHGRPEEGGGIVGTPKANGHTPLHGTRNCSRCRATHDFSFSVRFLNHPCYCMHCGKTHSFVRIFYTKEHYYPVFEHLVVFMKDAVHPQLSPCLVTVRTTIQCLHHPHHNGSAVERGS